MFEKQHQTKNITDHQIIQILYQSNVLTQQYNYDQYYSIHEQLYYLTHWQKLARSSINHHVPYQDHSIYNLYENHIKITNSQHIFYWTEQDWQLFRENFPALSSIWKRIKAKPETWYLMGWISPYLPISIIQWHQQSHIKEKNINKILPNGWYGTENIKTKNIVIVENPILAWKLSTACCIEKENQIGVYSWNENSYQPFWNKGKIRLLILENINAYWISLSGKHQAKIYINHGQSLFHEDYTLIKAKIKHIYQQARPWHFYYFHLEPEDQEKVIESLGENLPKVIRESFNKKTYSIAIWHNPITNKNITITKNGEDYTTSNIIKNKKYLPKSNITGPGYYPSLFNNLPTVVLHNQAVTKKHWITGPIHTIFGWKSCTPPYKYHQLAELLSIPDHDHYHFIRTIIGYLCQLFAHKTDSNIIYLTTDHLADQLLYVLGYRRMTKKVLLGQCSHIVRSSDRTYPIVCNCHNDWYNIYTTRPKKLTLVTMLSHDSKAVLQAHPEWIIISWPSIIQKYYLWQYAEYWIAEICQYILSEGLHELWENVEDTYTLYEKISQAVDWWWKSKFPWPSLIQKATDAVIHTNPGPVAGWLQLIRALSQYLPELTDWPYHGRPIHWLKLLQTMREYLPVILDEYTWTKIARLAGWSVHWDGEWMIIQQDQPSVTTGLSWYYKTKEQELPHKRLNKNQ